MTFLPFRKKLETQSFPEKACPAANALRYCWYNKEVDISIIFLFPTPLSIKMELIPSNS